MIDCNLQGITKDYIKWCNQYLKNRYNKALCFDRYMDYLNGVQTEGVVESTLKTSISQADKFLKLAYKNRDNPDDLTKLDIALLKYNALVNAGFKSISEVVDMIVKNNYQPFNIKGLSSRGSVEIITYLYNAGYIEKDCDRDNSNFNMDCGKKVKENMNIARKKKASSKFIPKPCPYCGCKNITLCGIKRTREGLYDIGLYCSSCKAIGPRSIVDVGKNNIRNIMKTPSIRDELTKKWNMRVG